MNPRSLVIDVGNTHTVIGIYSEGLLAQSWRLATERTRTEDEHFGLLSGLLASAGESPKGFDICALASVVPDLTRSFTHMVEKYIHCPLVVINGNTDLGIRYPVSDHSHVGADLVVNAYAAWRKYQRPCIVCDFGTATTVQLVGADGFFYGVAIIPGVITSSSRLFERAALLTNVELKPPEHLLGSNTRDALLSGILTGNAMMMDGFVERIRAQYSDLGEIYAIGTGGIAPLVCGLCSNIDCVDKTLTLDGLYFICQRFFAA